MLISEGQMNRLRIAIALLPWPHGVRTAQDAVRRLQDAFPLKNGKEGEHWKQRAGELRKEVAGLQQSRDMLRIQVLSLTQKISADGHVVSPGEKRPAEDEELGSANPPKKRKRNPQAVPFQVEDTTKRLSKLEAILSISDVSSTCDAYHPQLLSILRGIHTLVNSPDSDPQLLRRSLERALETIGTVLAELLRFHCEDSTPAPPHASLPPASSHVDLIVSLSGITSALLAHISARFTEGADSFIQRLSDHLLAPIIRSIIPFSRSFLRRALDRKSTFQAAIIDIRPALLDLLGTIMSVKDCALKEAACERVAFDIVKELEAAFLEAPVVSSSASVRRAQRRARLARKDAIPHLCSVLRSALSSHRDARSDLSSPHSLYLATSTFKKLSALQFQLFTANADGEPADEIVFGRRALGVVAEEALLTVIELAWMCCPLDDRTLEEEKQESQTEASPHRAWWDTVMN